MKNLGSGRTTSKDCSSCAFVAGNLRNSNSFWSLREFADNHILLTCNLKHSTWLTSCQNLACFPHCVPWQTTANSCHWMSGLAYGSIDIDGILQRRWKCSRTLTTLSPIYRPWILDVQISPNVKHSSRGADTFSCSRCTYTTVSYLWWAAAPYQQQQICCRSRRWRRARHAS
jgi:hypothetical protein